MRAEDGCGARCADLVAHAPTHRDGLALVGHHAADRPGTHDGWHGESDGVGGDIGQAWEPTLAQLLLPARNIQGHLLDQQWVVEVGHRGVVEGDMPILADSDCRTESSKVGTSDIYTRQASSGRGQAGVPSSNGKGVLHATSMAPAASSDAYLLGEAGSR